MSVFEGPIKEIALGFYDGPHATPPESDEGPIFLGIKNVTPGGRLDLSEIRHVSDQHFAKWTRRVTPTEGDIVMSYEATLHRYALIPEGFHGCLGRRMALIRPDSRKVNSRFLHYYFLSSRWRSVIEGNIINGATVDRVPLKRLPDFEVRIPSLKSQKKIAATLAAYDDLIENNRRRIELLEQSARLLYKEWFVHLRFPGHEHVTITNGIPDGWERKPLSAIAEFRLGKMLDQRKNRGELMPYLGNKNVRWGDFDFDNIKEMRFEERELEKFGLKHGDIVMCEGGVPGRCAIWKEQVPGMMIQKALHRIRPHKGLDHRYLYYNLSYQGQTGRLSGLFTGATIKHLPREKLAKVEVDIPPAALTGRFIEQVAPIESQIDVLQSSTKLAAQARDLLLPRLMNGEIPV